MVRSLVTGGSGFVGSHVVDALRNAGHEVIVFDRERPREQLGVEFFSGELNDLDAVCRAAQGVDYIHHVAAVANVNHAFERPIDCVETNVLGSVHVLEAARRANVRRVLFASTVWVYNAAREPWVDEDSPLYMPGPGHIYTSSKIACELMFHDYAALYKIPITVFRYGIPYGPRMRAELLIPIFLKRALSGQPLLVAGDGKQARNFVYVEDVARAHVLGLADSCENQIINLDGTQSVSVLEVATKVRELVGGHVTIEHTPGRPGDYAGKRVSLDKAQQLMGWSPSTGFDEGMRRTFSWYVATYGGAPSARPEARPSVS